MAIFGFIVYLVATLYVTVVALGITCWPGVSRVESILALSVAGIMWFGVYSWSPIGIVVT